MAAVRGRRERHVRDVRQRLAVAAVAVVAGLVAASAGVPRATTAEGAAGAAGPGPLEQPIGSDSYLLAHTDAGGRLDLALLVGMTEGDDAATVAVVPPSTVVFVPGTGVQPLSDVVRAGGTRLLGLVFENALGADVRSVTLLDDAALARVLAPAGELQVTVDDVVHVQTDDGVLELKAGRNTVTSDDAARLFTGTEPAGELAHRATVAAVVEAWRARLRDDVARLTVDAEPAIAPLVRLAVVPFEYPALPIVPEPGGRRFRLDDPAVREFVSDRIPWARFGGGASRPRVEVRDGTGAGDVALEIASVVVPTGAHVTRTAVVEGFGVTRSQVVYYRPDAEAVAEKLAEALGAQVSRAAEPAAGEVDVTIVVGADLRAPGSEESSRNP
jgi:hypothetical protein